MAAIREGAFDPGPAPAPTVEPETAPTETPQLEDLRTKCLRRLREQEEAAAAVVDPSLDWYKNLQADADLSESTTAAMTQHLVYGRGMTVMGVDYAPGPDETTVLRYTPDLPGVRMRRKASPSGTLRRVWAEKALMSPGNHLYFELDTPQGIRGFGARLEQRMDAKAVIYELRCLADLMERSLDA